MLLQNTFINKFYFIFPGFLNGETSEQRASIQSVDMGDDK